MTLGLRSDISDCGIQYSSTDKITINSGNVIVQAPLTVTGDIVANGNLVPTGSNIINLTGATTDHTLAVGQVAIIDSTGATSIPLHIACGDGQLYEYWLNSSQLIAGTATCYLQPNNINYGAVFTYREIYCNNAAAAGSAAANVSYFYVEVGAGAFVVYGTLSTVTIAKTGISMNASSSSTISYTGVMASRWQDTTTAWTSLGTLQFGHLWAGRITIRRVT